MKAARVRVRLKGGAYLHVLPLVMDPNTAQVLADVRATLNNHGTPVAGFAFVVWDNEGGSTSAWSRFARCPIPTPLIPEFLRTRMVLAIAGRWAAEDVNASWGIPPDGAS